MGYKTPYNSYIKFNFKIQLVFTKTTFKVNLEISLFLISGLQKEN